MVEPTTTPSIHTQSESSIEPSSSVAGALACSAVMSKVRVHQTAPSKFASVASIAGKYAGSVVVRQPGAPLLETTLFSQCSLPPMSSVISVGQYAAMSASNCARSAAITAGSTAGCAIRAASSFAISANDDFAMRSSGIQGSMRVPPHEMSTSPIGTSRSNERARSTPNQKPIAVKSLTLSFVATLHAPCSVSAGRLAVTCGALNQRIGTFAARLFAMSASSD